MHVKRLFFLENAGMKMQTKFVTNETVRLTIQTSSKHSL